MSRPTGMIQTERAAGRAKAAAVGTLLTIAAAIAWAHEGHAPLPSRGVQVDAAGGKLVLSRQAREALDVRTAAVESRPVGETVVAPTTLAAPWQGYAFVSPRLPGRLVRLLAGPGDVVKAGQPLAEVESLELETLRLEVRNAANELAIAEKALAGQEQAASSGAVSEEVLRQARARVQQGRNALDLARLKCQGLDPAAGDATGTAPGTPGLVVVSPIGGVVLHADLPVGKVIAPGEHLFEVVDPATVWARVGVLEQDFHLAAAGQPVALTLTAFPGEVFHAKLRGAVPYLDPQTHLGTAWAELGNASGRGPRLLPGMFGHSEVVVAGDGPVTAVPAEALVADGADRFVLVEESSAAAGASAYGRQYVVTGRRTADWVEVRGGTVYPGDRVVTRGVHQLAGLLPPGGPRPGPEAARNIGLRVEPATERVVEDVLEVDAAAELPPGRRAFVSSPIPGSLRSVRVDPGQVVRAGEMVAELLGPELQDLQLELLRAHLEGEVLATSLKQFRAVGEAVPRRTTWEAESQLAVARNRREAARRKLTALGLTPEQIAAVLSDRKLVASLPLRAPVGGVVVAFNGVLGQAVRAEEPLFEVQDLSRVWFRGSIAENDLALLRAGQRARARLLGGEDVVAEGVVRRVGGALAGDGRTLSVWVEAERPPTALVPNERLARLTLTLSRPAPTLAVPLSAVVRDGSQAFVFVRKPDGSFERRSVETGRSDDRSVEVTRGLKVGDETAVGGADGLAAAYAAAR